MPKYKIVAGKHIQRTNGVQTLYSKDDVIESDDKMIAQDRRKFMLVDPATPVSPGQPTKGIPVAAPPSAATTPPVDPPTETTGPKSKK